MDRQDGVSVGEAVAKARPQVITQQMTAIPMAHAGKPDLKPMDQWFAGTNRERTEGTDHLPVAAEATTDDLVEFVHNRRVPVVGGGTGHRSWVHLGVAPSSTVLAAERQVRGVVSLIDDEPAPP